MPFRFVHTADLHLDSPLKTLALRDAGLADLIGTATRTALTRIVDLCLAESVDALLVAGDLYDGGQTSMKTAGFLQAELRRVTQGGVRVFVIRGNHDAEARITRELTMPDGVHMFTPRPGRTLAEMQLVARDSGPDVAIHGLSFDRPQAPDNPLPRFAAAVQGCLNIGMLHTSLGGSEGHDTYAPSSVAALQGHGFDYWALGHIHIGGVWSGRSTVVMPGIPQGRDIGEGGAKSVALVTLADDGQATVEHRSVAVARFDRCAVDLTGIADRRGAVRAIETALATARTAMDAEHLVLRLVLTGQAPVAWLLRRDADQVLEEARAAAAGIGTVWIDKVENATRPGAADGLSGPLAELQVALPGLAGDPALAAAAGAALDAVTRALPATLRDTFGKDEADRARILAELMSEGAAEVLAALTATREGAA